MPDPQRLQAWEGEASDSISDVGQRVAPCIAVLIGIRQCAHAYAV